ncbi:MAG: alpha/beta hydrolase [Actinomycetota bacterium]|nr:alpha/beta hydrolase [Actinomycetota bacterium]
MVLAVDDAGGPGAPVVCLPMLGTSRVATAMAFGPALAGMDGLREVYLDLPGHGDSPGDGPADSQTVLTTVCAWLESHLDRPALLAGSSYGAYLAAGIARQRPELVGGLLLVCAGVRVGADERDLPEQEPPPAEPGWLAAAPPELRGHLDRALGHRTAAVAATVLAALSAGGPSDEQYQDALSGGPGYNLADQDADIVFNGPVAMIAGRNDRVVGYADQFRALRNYPRGTYSALAAAGHYLAFEQPTLFRALTQDWLHRCDA